MCPLKFTKLFFKILSLHRYLVYVKEKIVWRLGIVWRLPGPAVMLIPCGGLLHLQKLCRMYYPDTITKAMVKWVNLEICGFTNVSLIILSNLSDYWLNLCSAILSSSLSILLNLISFEFGRYYLESRWSQHSNGTSMRRGFYGHSCRYSQLVSI